jgi:DNA mismatch endonuclease (patch repair protein)
VKQNQERDSDTDRRLLDAGWLSLRIWEHEDPGEAALKVRAAVARRLKGPALIP